ncbi:MAG: endonuclease VIII [Aphanocapsa sp. GSE-SYN-MK-11-07L]|jgi:endonuclease-8|nr:endonuclease VIII [Aphanocapsa sp. GSE-SYN-MK-11-07L]
MPEGPEIKLAADQIGKAIAAQPITEVFFAFESLKLYQDVLRAEQVVAVEPRGKALLIRFSNQLSIYSHNQLYGVWYTRPAYRYPPTSRQLRLAIHTAKKSALLYSASDIQVLKDDEIAAHPFLSKLGPDVLDPATTVEMIRDRLLDKRFFRRGFPSLLLDQHFLSGLGNYLRSEILFVAGVYPTLRPVDCTAEQLAKLATAAIALPRQSYATKGITNDLAIANQLKAAGKQRRQYRHWVFSRQGQFCYICGTAILKQIAGGRRVYYCPGCQSKGRK